MPVAEPPATYGFWPQVKALSGWPETDEDAVTQLAAAWTKGAQGFTAAGQTDTSGVATAWADPAGAAFGAKVGHLGKVETALGQAMQQMATAVTGFATEVAATKNNIVQAVTPNISVYASCTTLPPGAGQAAAQSLVQQVGTEVKSLIDQAAARVGANVAGQSPGPQAQPGAGAPPAGAPAPAEPKPGETAQTFGDISSATAGIFGALSLTPAAPVAVPITIAASLLAVLAHGYAMEQKGEDPNQDVTVWDWVGLFGDAAGGYGAVKAVGLGVMEAARLAAAAAPHSGMDLLRNGVAAATKEGSAIAPAWGEAGSRLANRLGKSAEFGESVAVAGQGTASALPQVPTISEQTGGEASEESKNMAATGGTFGSFYNLLGKAH